MAKNSSEAQKKYDAKRAGRTRNFVTLVYPEDLPENWRELLDDTRVKWVESPLHDKDFNPDGTPKKPHHHVLTIFEVVKTLDQVKDFYKSLFGESDTGSIIGVASPQTCLDRCGTVRYMAHLDHPSKAQYDVSQIVGHNGADPADIMKYSQSETIQMMIDVEKFIEEKKILELCDLSALIREDHPDWYILVTTRNTVYFNAFIRSFRHKHQHLHELAQSVENGSVYVNSDGEVKNFGIISKKETSSAKLISSSGTSPNVPSSDGSEVS